MSKSRKIALAGMFAAIAVVLKTMSFMPIDSLKISFLYIPCFLAGIYLGPVFGFLTGVTGDFLGTLLVSYGKPISPFTLFNSGLIGFIMGIVFHYVTIKNNYARILIGAGLVLCIVTMLLNTLALTLPPLSYYPNFLVALPTRLLQPIVILINTLITLAAVKILDTTPFKMPLPYRIKQNKIPIKSQH